MITFVTGGAGFLGRQVVRTLAQSGASVRCLLRGTSQVDELRSCVGEELWPRVTIVQGELAQVETYLNALEGADVVFHLAAGLGGGAALLFMNTVVATRVFARACAETKVSRFVLVSSLGVYSSGHLRPGSVLDESCPVDPEPQRRDAYSFSKIVQEQVCWDFYRELSLPIVVIRPGVIFGPGRGAHSSRVGLTFAGRTWRIGGTRQLPYTYVDNCADAICRAGSAPGVTGEAFNVLDDDLPTVRSVLRAYDRCGQPIRSVLIPQFAIGAMTGLYERYSRWSGGQLPDVLSRYRADAMWKPLVFNNAKAKARLGWKPQVPIAEALDRAIRSCPALRRGGAG